MFTHVIFQHAPKTGAACPLTIFAQVFNIPTLRQFVTINASEAQKILVPHRFPVHFRADEKLPIMGFFTLLPRQE